MTTLIGIVAGKGNPSVVLASDLQGTSEEWEERGDYAIRRQERSEHQKIHINDANDLAVCMTGTADGPYRGFLFDLLHGKHDFREAIKASKFEPLARLNYDRFGGRTWDNNHTNTLFVATRYDNKPQLWKCWPLGKIDEMYMAAEGSGSKHATNYLRELNYLCSRDIDAGNAVDATVGALKVASRDLYTTGMDIVVVRGEDILRFGDLIKNSIRKAEENAIDNIKSQLK